MSLWTRVANVFRADTVNQQLDEEFESHIAEAIASGRDPLEARRAFGSVLRQREESREATVMGWLEGLRADAVFGWRQLLRNRVTFAAAVFSLALAMGSCVSAFRLIDALLWRPLPVSHPERLYALSRYGLGWDGKMAHFDGWAYPSFARMRDAVRNDAELIAVSPSSRSDLTFGSDEEMEKAYLQYVSGTMFNAFGLQPTLGRLLTPQDDRTPGKSPYAVLSYDFWTRRFHRDPQVVGKTFRLGDKIYEVVGVGPKSFTGTEPGTMTDVFLPVMMHGAVTRDDSTFHRTLAIMRPGVNLEPVRAKLDAVSRGFETERAKGFKDIPKKMIQNFLDQRMEMIPASAGTSSLQESYRHALSWLGALVVLVLLIACANVANLMTALASARAREMALRVSLGAGRWRLVQMVLVESAMLAGCASVLGALFAWWSAPRIVGMINPPDRPARLALSADWRVLAFGVGLVLAVTLLFGLLPALRASAVKPVSALKGGEDPHARRRMMYGMIAAQIAFCFVIVFTAGLFVSTFQRISHLQMGFSPEGLILLETSAPQGQTQAVWDEVADALRSTPGVERVGESGWALLTENSWNNTISIDGGPPSEVLSHFLRISPGWFETVKMPLVAGRDLRPGDTFPGTAVVNEAFAKQFFKGVNPVGRTFDKMKDDGTRLKCKVVGMVANAFYRDIREGVLPVAYVPFDVTVGKDGVARRDGGTFAVRSAGGNLLLLGAELRRKATQTRAGFRVTNVQTQQELVDAQTIRERLLALLGIFFASVALLLAGIGLYGVMNYSVMQRRREIGIRVAVGARSRSIAGLVAKDMFAMVTLGVAVGSVAGIASARYLETLFYEVKAADPVFLTIPAVVILSAALLAAVPAVMRALAIEPAEILRSE
ncbi:ABC transporter permease [Terriglobus saanensis]|uniref:Permease n=1 Tax=Terriglobus saanensis (strain ATCC BAA-1853 / DSM 23119 / SP1PR4) TaxID=401053 RepID=E8UZ32_TERSS|nr:ABC transporter permease [Terriglobus saanensis]ADV80977.1 permease [Terriglobus saanensis SP1PR4]